MTSPAPFAVIFDLDGTLVDTSAQHALSFEQLAREENRVLPPDYFGRAFGLKNTVIIPEIFGWSHDPDEIQRLSLRKEELYREILRTQPCALIPGVRPLLDALHAAGVPCAIGSSTARPNIDAILAILGLAPRFAALASGDDVTRSKPNPDVFLLAARLLGVPPGRCIVFEDATFGVEAALRAGMGAIGVTTGHNLAPALHAVGAHRVLDRLDEISPDELAALLEEKDKV